MVNCLCQLNNSYIISGGAEKIEGKTKIKDNSKEGIEYAWSLLFAFLDSITEIYFNLENQLITIIAYGPIIRFKN